VLIKFRVRNYRSLRDDNVLSLVASTDKTLKSSNVAQAGVASLPGTLRTAGIYGANASGKSNLIRAMALMRAVIVQSASLQPGQPFNVQPFALDPAFKDQPTEFEVTFVRDAIRYQFGFSFDSARIQSEWLIVYKTAQPQSWYTREFNKISGEEHYKFGSHFQGQRQLWRSSTRPNALFLSIAVQLNSEQLKPVFDWFAGLTVAEQRSLPMLGGVHSLQFTLDHVQQSESIREKITKFLSGADVGISQVEITKEKGFQQALSMYATGKVESTRQEVEIPVPKFLHSSDKARVQFNLGDESEGTQRLFMLAGPLFEILRTGSVLFVDELDRSLHALLVRQIVEMFQTPSLNPLGAQLVFTTHDTSLLSADLLRRDQVWLVERDRDLASRVYPLSDFAPRKREALERGYLSGRYGAVPILKQPDALLVDAKKS
jgi:AAA15 family ATPase/GTPase